MAGVGGVFHVEFGINDTELTRCLEENNDTDAERIILRNSFSSYLDEGCYQRTPLYIVLCGRDQDDQGPIPRNLHIARCLAQNGANVNYRVPATFYGCEYMGPGKSGLELVVELFNLITLHSAYYRPISDFGQMIGLDNEVIMTRDELEQQLLDLAFFMTTHGGDVNIRDEFRQTLLHRALIYSRDPRMLYLLCENGSDINATDAKGNTPLGSLCDGFPRGVDHFLDMSCDGMSTDPYADHAHLTDRQEMLDYLLDVPGIQVSHQNNLGHTALFHCLVRGDVVSARKLLNQGCDVSLKGSVKDGSCVRLLSPLYASLCGHGVVKSHMDKYIANSVPQLQWLSNFVDQGHFSTKAILSELHEFIDSDFSEFMHLKRLPNSSLIHLMFGDTTSTLRQKATRKIFQTTFLSQFSPTSSIFPCGGSYFKPFGACSF